MKLSWLNKLFFAFACLPLLASQTDFFSNPLFCTMEEVSQLLDIKTLDMCWNFGKESHFRFVSRNTEVYFEIVLKDLPESYNDFIHKMKDKFVEDENGCLIFSHKIENDGTEIVNNPENQATVVHADDTSYLLNERRSFKQANPQPLRTEQLESIIRNKKVVFYTGAGLSIGSQVHSMKELENLLGLELNMNFIYSLEKAINNPKEFASNILIFHKACLYNPPSKAHVALKELAIFKNMQIVTENLDTLHESSGIVPYRIEAEQLRAEVGPESLSQIEYMICVGLSHDDRGFLGWYKHHNPQGKIIAIDLSQPSYLGDEDFLLKGDLQEILPSIAAAFSTP